MLMKKIVVILAFCSTVLGIPCDTLYILQDAGETTALLGVIQKAEKNHDSYAILSGGTSATFLQRHPELISKVTFFDSLKVEEKIDRDWNRGNLLSQKSVDLILDQFQPCKVVSGVAFEFHGQLLKAFEVQGAHTYAFWDNINSDGSDPYFKTAQKVASCAQTLLAPSYSFLKTYPNAQIVGQPTLESVPHRLPVRPRLASNLPAPFQHHPLLIWIGGYGDAYNEALSQFLQGADQLANMHILLTYHPKYNGKIEKEMLEKYPNPHITLMDPAWRLDSMEAIALSDVVICHQSTMGLQAALGGKRVIYFTPLQQTYMNLLIQNQVAVQVSSIEELKNRLDQPQEIPSNVLEILQIPNGSIKRIYQILHTSTSEFR